MNIPLYLYISTNNIVHQVFSFGIFSSVVPLLVMITIYLVGLFTFSFQKKYSQKTTEGFVRAIKLNDLSQADEQDVLDLSEFFTFEHFAPTLQTDINKFGQGMVSHSGLPPNLSYCFLYSSCNYSRPPPTNFLIFV